MPDASVWQSVLSAARDFFSRGWSIVPVEPGEKECYQKGWPEFTFGLADLPRYFGDGCNIAVITGTRSHDLCDVDLDCREAVALADIYLPGTEAIFGRNSKPRSHWLYTAPGANFMKFSDPLAAADKATLLELRATGQDGGAHLTLLPPSIVAGERRSWEGDIVAPRLIAAGQLRRALTWLAIGSLVARHVGETPARRPQRDLPKLLAEVDTALTHRAAEWLARCEPQPPRPVRRRNFTHREINLAALVATIPNNCDWYDWNKVGLAVFAASGGSAAGLQVFHEFSARSPKYRPTAVDERWRNYHRSPPTRLTVGTLVYLSRQARGWS